MSMNQCECKWIQLDVNESSECKWIQLDVNSNWMSMNQVKVNEFN